MQDIDKGKVCPDREDYDWVQGQSGDSNFSDADFYRFAQLHKLARLCNIELAEPRRVEVAIPQQDPYAVRKSFYGS
jgi:hypothetical protein